MITRRATCLVMGAATCAANATSAARAQCDLRLLSEFGGRPQAREYGEIAIAGEVFLVATGLAGLESIDATDLEHPRERDRLVLEGAPIAHVTADGALAVASSGSQLVLVDASDPARLAVLDMVALASEVRGLAMRAGTLYVAAGTGGLQTFTITEGRTLEPAGTLVTASPAVGLGVEGAICYLLTESTGLVVDVSAPIAPVVLAGDAPTGRVVDVDSGRAYVGDVGISIVSLAEPSAPSVIVTLSGALAPNRCLSLDASGNVLAGMFQVTGGQPCCDDCHSFLYDLRIHTLDLASLPAVSLIAGETYGNRRGGGVCLHDGYVCFDADEAGVAFARVEDPWVVSAAVGVPLNNTEFFGFTADPLVPIDAGVMCLQRFLPKWQLRASIFALVATDVSSPGSPVVTSTGAVELWGLGWYRLDLVQDGIAYITGAEAVNWGWRDCADPNLWGVLQTVDITDAAHPVPLDRWRTPGADVGQTLASTVLDGAVAYTRAFTIVDVGTYVLDVSKPQDIQPLAAYPTAFGWVACAHNGLLVVDRGGALVLVDGANVADPVDIAPLPVNGMVRMIGDRLYVFGDNFSVVDVSQPNRPCVLGSLTINPTGPSNQFAVDGTLAACGRRISAELQQVSIVDFADPTNPRIVLQYDTSLNANFTWTHGVLLEGPFNDEPMRIYDVNGAVRLTSLANADTSDTSFGVVAHRGLAFVSDYAAGVRIFDVSDTTSPAEVGSYDTPDRAYQTVVLDSNGSTLAYVADGSTGLLVLDVTDPSAPTPLSSLATSDLALALAVDNNFAYLACRFEGLQIVDITNPAAPVLVGSVDTPGSAQSVTLDGNLAYVADGSAGVQVINISNRSLPTIIGSYDTPLSARQVLIRGPVAYVPDRTNGLIALDVSDPTNPRHISTLAGLGDARGITDFGHLAFVTDFNGAVHMIDIADPLNMHLLQSVPTLGTARAITHDANTIYLADGDAGLSILEARPCWYRPCPADLNNDASLDFFDVQMYLNAYSGADGLADWNDDGQINFFDVQRYLIDFSQGCVF